MKIKKWLPLLLVAIAFGALGAYFGARPAPPDPVAGLFASSFPDTRGTQQDLARWKGKTLLVNFWATWCAPCVEEMPELSALQNEIGPRNGQIIGIGIDTSANIAEFSTKMKISYPLYVAGMGAAELARALGNQLGGLPFSVLIGPDGKVKATYLGRIKLEQLRRDIQAAGLR